MIKYIQAIDLKTFHSVLNYPSHPALTKLALILSFTADGWLYFILLPIIILLKPVETGTWLALALTAFAIERGLYFVLKNTFKRKRPPAAIEGFKSIIMASDEFSLPSGHTSAAFLFVTFLSFGLSPLFIPLYLWACGVGAARVILGVHFPTDILSGALMGTCIALLVI